MRFALLFILSLAISLPASSDFSKNTDAPAVGSNDSIVVHDTTSLSRVEQKIRRASVKIASPNEFIFGSGSYFVYGDDHIVITAAHVVRDEPYMKVIGRDGEKVFGSVIYIDEGRDVAVLRIPNLRTRQPIELSFSTDSFESLIGCNVVYTGFPGGHDLVTIKGSVAGIIPDRKFILMHGYAWMGASGSGVFDKKGNLVGVLSAVSVGNHFDLQIIEDMVWISPVVQMDTLKIIEAISKT